MKHSYVVVCALVLTVPGCVMDDAELEEGDEAASEDTGTASEALQLTGGEAKWSQGSAPVGLGPTYDRVCFLTGIQGNFAGSGESVQVYQSNGSWYLGGKSLQTGVAAWASCVYNTTYTGEYGWNQGNAYPTSLGSAADRTCFITRVGGGFNSSNEWVHAYVSAGEWFLTGGSAAGGVSVGARCVIYSLPQTGEISWITPDVNPKYMCSSASACILNKITGRFDSGSDRIHCDLNAGSWYLGGNGYSGWLGGRARCF